LLCEALSSLVAKSYVAGGRKGIEFVPLFSS
jgi:hypothetical protein